MKIAHISDTHFVEDRLPDLDHVLDAAIAAWEDESIDLILHGGDFFDKRSTPAERTALARFLQHAAEIAPVVGCRGNHDAPGDLSIFNMLSADYPIRIFDRPDTWIEVVDGAAAKVFAVPWFDKVHVASMLPADAANPEITRNRTIEAARDMLLSLAAQVAEARREGYIPIVLSHAMVSGSVMSSGQVIQGTTVELTPYDWNEVGAEYVALGHVHKAQAWFDGRVAYSGSPIRHNFGEPEAKGWNLVTIRDGQWVSTEFRELPARRIVLLEEDFTQGVPEWWTRPGPLQLPTSALVPGALVRLRYKVTPALMELVNVDMLKVILIQAGAVDVKLEAQVEHSDRVRSEAITQARSTWERIAAYWQEKGITFDPETTSRLRERLGALEAEARR